MFMEVLFLLKKVEVVDEYGDIVRTYDERMVYARKDKVYISQKVDAGAKGQQVDLKFTLSDNLDYEGEEEARYNGKLYQVMSGDSKSREIELLLYGGVEIGKT